MLIYFVVLFFDDFGQLHRHSEAVLEVAVLSLDMMVSYMYSIPTFNFLSLIYPSLD